MRSPPNPLSYPFPLPIPSHVHPIPASPKAIPPIPPTPPPPNPLVTPNPPSPNPEVTVVVQEEQKGLGHAVLCAQSALKPESDSGFGHCQSSRLRDWMGDPTHPRAMGFQLDPLTDLMPGRMSCPHRFLRFRSPFSSCWATTSTAPHTILAPRRPFPNSPATLQRLPGRSCGFPAPSRLPASLPPTPAAPLSAYRCISLRSLSVLSGPPESGRFLIQQERRG